MAELLATACRGAMPSLLRKLDAFLMSSIYELGDEMQNDFRFLRAELDVMDTFLRRMSEIEEHCKQAQRQAVIVRDLSYGIEDRMDRLMLLESSDRGEIIAKEIRGIMKLIDEVKDRHSKYTEQIDNEMEAASMQIPADPRPRFLYADVSELVGIEVLMDDLIFMLTCGEDEGLLLQRMVSIVGFGGSGKTTLAKQLYQELRPQFDCCAFVSVSRKPNINWTLRSMLCQIRNDLCVYAEAWDENQLIDEIMDFLQDKRYLIVVDDIWGIDAWEDIECVFIENGCANRVITTTRKIDVANSCATHELFVYKIGPLTALGSQELLFKRLGWKESCPAEMSETSKWIIEKCGGLPLAIIALSSLLASNQTRDGWNQVRDSIFSAVGTNYDIEIMRRVFHSSYVDLPRHLKTCLLYMAIFPENYDIPKVHLVNKWIAEGFICFKNGEDPHELGESYLNELINRSLIRRVKTLYNGKVGFCQVLPIVRDFLKFISMEQNFATSISSFSYSNADYNKVRRISLVQNNNEGNAIICPSLITSPLRSLTVFGSILEILPHLSNFTFLRVLDLRDCDVLENHHLTNIETVSLLRYLNVSRTCVSVLPMQIGDLQFLDTLDASYSKVKELPTDIYRLVRLVHLHVPQKTMFPHGMARLQNLQELEHVDVFSHSVSLLRELDQLTNLKMLSITLDYNKMEQGNQSHKEMLLSSLHQLETHNLGDLRIKFELANEGNISADSWQCHCLGSLRDLNIHAEGIIKVPEWLTSLNNISLLSLAVKDMDRNDLSVVGHIPNLLHFSLVLRDPDPESSSVIISRSHGFEKLKNFIFSSRRRLLFGYRAMPNVIDVTFFIYTSSCLRSACGIRNLSNLENIGVLLIGQDPSEVRAAGDAFKSAVSVHSSRPTLEIYSWAVIQGEEEEEEEEGRRIRRCIRRSGYSRIQDAF